MHSGTQARALDPIDNALGRTTWACAECSTVWDLPSGLGVLFRVLGVLFFGVWASFFGYTGSGRHLSFGILDHILVCAHISIDPGLPEPTVQTTQEVRNT